MFVVSYRMYTVLNKMMFSRIYLQLFVGGLMSYLPPVVCRRAHVLFTLFVFVWFVFTSSCL